MNAQTSLQHAEELLSPWGRDASHPEQDRLDVVVPPENLIHAVEALHNTHWGTLSAITGLDCAPETDTLETLYHFCAGAAVVTLRVPLPRRGEASLPSIAGLVPVAIFFEKEIQEMLGIPILGLDSSRLFLPDNWPDDVYPLRAEFDPAQPVAFKPGVQNEIPEQGRQGNKFIVPIGPQHPALKEPGHFEFEVDGEVVTAARMRLGYAHRGIEKSAEKRNWTQNLYLVERVCGICSHTHAFAYCLGVEKMAQVEAPPRAQAIRELIAGLERLHSHLLWLGVAAHEAGFDTLFMYSWRDRETVMQLLETITGNRVNYSINTLGGVKTDITPEMAAALKKGMDYMEERVRYYLDVVSTDSMFLSRTRGIGTISRAEAEFFGLVGPTARASGVTRDVRVDAPYSAYTKFPVSLITDEGGDLAARFVVRMKELLVSCFTIRTILDNLPPGDLTVRIPRKLPAVEVISRVEAPRGEAFYFIKSGGGETPLRLKIRTPSLCNWTSVLQKAVGRQLADVPMLISGMDPCFSCNDRMITVRRKGEGRIYSFSELRKR